MISWHFLTASFLLWLTPGPDTMYILTRSLVQGRSAGVMSALGIGTGLLIHTVLAAFGLSAILAASAWAFAAVKIAGAAYLVYLGFKALRKDVGPLAAPQLCLATNWRVYQQGVVCNTLNPKVAIFFLAFLPQFVDPAVTIPVPCGHLRCRRYRVVSGAGRVCSERYKNYPQESGAARLAGALFGLCLHRVGTELAAVEAAASVIARRRS